MKPDLRFQLPRLYVFILVMVVVFSVLNIIILFYGRNLFLYFQAIWSWAGVLLVAMIGAMLIGMFLSYRILAYREFTPFEREMMEMRLEVDECRDLLKGLRERLDDIQYASSPSQHGKEGDGEDEGS